jgi:DNA polymerase-2
MERIESFLVHAWTDYSSGRIYLTGRAVDGRSFAAVEEFWRPALYVPRIDADRALALARAAGIAAEAEDTPLVTPSYSACVALRLADRGRRALAARLAEAGLSCWGGDEKAADQYLAERGISAGIALEGTARAAKRVDLAFVNPRLEPCPAGEAAALRWLSLDIETTREGHLTACALAMEERRASFIVAGRPVRGATALPDERGLLQAARDAIVAWDPDLITGWNVVDFDLRVIAERARALGLAFDAGRTDASLKILESPGQRTLAVLEGRRCVDAMKVMRSGQERYEDQRLDTVARGILGEGKLLGSQGKEKLDELEDLLRLDPESYAAYCQRDAELPLAILEKSGMGELTKLRSALTGLDLERAWTSVPAFERVYGMALRSRGILPAPPAERHISGAAGGLILEPKPGLFDAVIVFDFRSLYPSIIRSFNIDPVAMARAEGDADVIEAPNGARFSRERGALPAIVDAWTALRADALAAGDGSRAYVLKILQNSFYGVLGSPGCAWADDLLSGAITGFGQEILRAARDWFVGRGYEVLYGDTDSLFVRVGAAAGLEARAAASEAKAAESAESVESVGAAVEGDGSDAANAAGTAVQAARLAEEASAALGLYVAERWRAESRLDLRFDKYYARFLIPRIRGDRGARLREELERSGASWLADALPGPKGRAKGYAGLLIRPDGSRSVDVKGLEAARGDWTPLARRFQLELLDIAFRPAPPLALEEEARAYARELATKLRSGRLDGELAFRRVLKRDLERYAADAPHVKAARLSGASSRGDVVEYVQTAAGPEPLGGAAGQGAAGRPDYAWYLERQLGPIWESIAEAAGWEADLSRVAGEQGELF